MSKKVTKKELKQELEYYKAGYEKFLKEEHEEDERKMEEWQKERDQEEADDKIAYNALKALLNRKSVTPGDYEIDGVRDVKIHFTGSSGFTLFGGSRDTLTVEFGITRDTVSEDD